MKITICGSVSFRKEIAELKCKLNRMGHEAIINPVMEDLAFGRNPKLMKQIEENHAKVKKDFGFIRWYYNAIVKSDAILVVNPDKNGVRNYIGGNTLMEMGFAHVNDKKVFLLNPVPDMAYKDEILAVVTEVINGDLGRIK